MRWQDNRKFYYEKSDGEIWLYKDYASKIISVFIEISMSGSDESLVVVLRKQDDPNYFVQLTQGRERHGNDLNTIDQWRIRSIGRWRKASSNNECKPNTYITKF